MEFHEFKKIPRLSRECVITEKIDGTNGVIYIGEDGEFLVGSHTRWLDEHTENHGFWHWAQDNKEELLRLGVGWHYGEWWGQGINRNYGLKEKRFSLFNTGRWVMRSPEKDNPNPPLIGKEEYCPECCYVVPVLYTGIFDTQEISNTLGILKLNGSFAQPGFMNPEGIVIFHRAGNILFKKTIEKDDEPKGKANA